MNTLELILLILGLSIGIIALLVLAYNMGKHKSMVPVVVGVVGIIFFGFSIWCMVDLNYYYTAKGGIYGVVSSLFHVNLVEGEDLEFSMKNIELRQVDGDQYSASIQLNRLIEFEEGVDYIITVNGVPTTTSTVTTTYAQASYEYSFLNEDLSTKLDDSLQFSFAFYANYTTLKVTTNGGSEAVRLWNSYFNKNNFVIKIEPAIEFDTAPTVGEGDISNYYMVTYMLDGERYSCEAYLSGTALDLSKTPQVEDGKMFLGWLDAEDIPIEQQPVKDNMVLYGYTSEPTLDFEIADGVITQYLGSDANVVIPASYSTFHGNIVEGKDYGITTIGDSLFFEDKTLQSVTIANGLTTIGKNTFNGCVGLTSVTIPNTVTSIGINAFENCINLFTAIIQSAEVYADYHAGALYQVAYKVYLPSSIDDGTNLSFNTWDYSKATEVVNGAEYICYSRTEALSTGWERTLTFYDKDGVTTYSTFQISFGNKISFPEEPKNYTGTVINANTGKEETRTFVFTNWRDAYGNIITADKIINSDLRLYPTYVSWA